MIADQPRLNFLGITRSRLEALLAELGEKPYRATQILKWIHHRHLDNFAEMSDISRSLRERLAEIGEIREPSILTERLSEDGTRKWLIRAESGSSVETVFIPEAGRGTLCVSSQVGCALDCSFCSTGKQGFNSNLTTAEIIGQVRIAIRALAKAYPERDRAVTNVVMMGMGEPLLNFDNVTAAVELMMDDLGYGISKRKVTISTAGVVPAIYRLAETTDASLAISLHAPNDALRDQLVPINRKYNIETLLAACRRYAENFGEKRTVTVEYTLLDGVNDQFHHAEELALLLADFPCKINLIPFNPFPGSQYKRPSMIAVRAFQDRLVRAGHSVTVRTTRGQDIQAACGQLVGEVEDRTKRQARYRRIAAEAIS
ncbi:MAG: 23S rRNA (adenine(2503)-C(2))-methyltransferase RlmN [Pseudomonadota bacterium]